jgi:hypothetical protein
MYTGNDPVNHTDPSGLQAASIVWRGQIISLPAGATAAFEAVMRAPDQAAALGALATLIAIAAPDAQQPQSHQDKELRELARILRPDLWPKAVPRAPAQPKPQPKPQPTPNPIPGKPPIGLPYGPLEEPWASNDYKYDPEKPFNNDALNKEWQKKLEELTKTWPKWKVEWDKLVDEITKLRKKDGCEFNPGAFRPYFLFPNNGIMGRAGLAAHHLNQTSAFHPVIDNQQGFAYALPTLQHQAIHRNLDIWWRAQRQKAKLPTNKAYGEAHYQAMIDAGVCKPLALILAHIARLERYANKLKDDKLVPQFPGNI